MKECHTYLVCVLSVEGKLKNEERMSLGNDLLGRMKVFEDFSHMIKVFALESRIHIYLLWTNLEKLKLNVEKGMEERGQG